MGSYRNNKQPSERWRRENTHRLTKAGIPPDIVNDAKRWSYVVLHGDDELDTGWHSDHLSAEQCRSLLGILLTHYGDEVGYGLIAQLRRRLQEES